MARRRARAGGRPDREHVHGDAPRGPGGAAARPAAGRRAARRGDRRDRLLRGARARRGGGAPRRSSRGRDRRAGADRGSARAVAGQRGRERCDARRRDARLARPSVGDASAHPRPPRLRGVGAPLVRPHARAPQGAGRVRFLLRLLRRADGARTEPEPPAGRRARAGAALARRRLPRAGRDGSRPRLLRTGPGRGLAPSGTRGATPLARRRAPRAALLDRAAQARSGARR